MLVAERDVVPDRGGEHVRLLEDEADLPPEIAVAQALRVGAVEQDRAGGRLEQAGQQAKQRRFARARASDDRHRRAGRDVEADPGEDGLARLRWVIAEVLQLDAALEGRDSQQLRLVGALLGLVVEHVRDPVEQDGRDLHVVPDVEEQSPAGRSPSGRGR